MKKMILLFASLMMAATWPLQALERLIDFKEWLGLQSPDEVGGITLYEHPSLHDALVKMIGEEKWQNIQENQEIPAPIEQIDGMMIVMGFNLDDLEGTGHTIFIDLATQRVVGLCLMETEPYPLPGDANTYNMPVKGVFIRHVTYYVLKDNTHVHRVDIYAYDEKTHCGNWKDKQAAEHWQSVLSLLAGEGL